MSMITPTAMSRTLQDAVSVDNEASLLGLGQSILALISGIALAASSIPQITQALRNQLKLMESYKDEKSLDQDGINDAISMCKQSNSTLSAFLKKSDHNAEDIRSRLIAFFTQLQLQADEPSHHQTKFENQALTAINDAISVFDEVRALPALFKQTQEAIEALGQQNIGNKSSFDNLGNSLNKSGHLERQSINDANAAEEGSRSFGNDSHEANANTALDSASDAADTDGSAQDSSNECNAAGSAESSADSSNVGNPYDCSVKKAKNAMDLACKTTTDQALQTLLSLLSLLHDEGADSAASKQQVLALVETRVEAALTRLNEEIIKDPKLHTGVIRESIRDQLIILHCSGYDLTQLQEAYPIVKDLLTELPSVPSRKGKKPQTTASPKAPRPRKPKDYYETPIGVTKKGKKTTFSFKGHRKLNLAAYEVIKGMVSSSFSGQEKADVCVDVKLTVGAADSDYPLEAFDCELSEQITLPNQTEDGMNGAQAEPSTQPIPPDKEPNKEPPPKVLRRLPIGALPVPGTDMTFGAIWAAVLMFITYALSYNASAGILYKRSHGHDNIYNFLARINDNFLHPLANAIRELFPLADIQQHDETSFSLATAARKLRDKLNRKSIFFLVSRGHILREDGTSKVTLAAWTFMGGRGYDSMYPLLKSFLGDNPTTKRVITDAFQLYDKILKELEVKFHQNCMVHFLRQFITALQGVFKELRQVADDKSLSHQQKLERMNQIVNRDRTTALMCRALATLRSIFQVDLDLDLNLPADEFARAQKELAAIRADLCSNLLDQLHHCMVELDAVEVDASGRYTAKANARAGKVCVYYFRNREKLRSFIFDTYLPKSTNAAERVVKNGGSRLKCTGFTFSSEKQISAYTNAVTVIETLKANGVAPFEGVIQLFALAFKVGFMVYSYDRTAVPYLTEGTQRICTQMRDVKLDDPAVGFQHWAQDALLYLLEHKSLNGFEEQLMPKLMEKINLSSRIALKEQTKASNKRETQAEVDLSVA